MQRAATYVSEFQRQLSSIVAEETYTQDFRDSRPPRLGPRPVTHRELRSDFLLVRTADARSYLEFRDVFAVDGQPVRDRQERLTNLFLQPTAGTRQQIQRILDESARYNIGTVNRNVNTPTLALLFLTADNQPRFRFKRAQGKAGAGAGELGAARGATSTNFKISTEVWVVEYEETQARTLIRTTAGRDIPARGRFWIEPSTGRVLMSELVADDPAVRATIDVSYQSEPVLGLLLPIEMRERYDGRRDGTIVEGNATYGKFRQFQVLTDEHLAR